jgi:hypothetical protein
MISAEEIMLENAWRLEMRCRGPEIQAGVMRLLHEPRRPGWKASDEISRFRRVFGEVLGELDGSDPLAMLRCVRGLHARLKDLKDAGLLFPSLSMDDIEGIQDVMLTEAWDVAFQEGMMRWGRDEAGRVTRIRSYPIRAGHPFVLEVAEWMMEEDKHWSVDLLIKSGRLDQDAVERWDALDTWVEGCDDEAVQEHFAMSRPGSRTARLVTARKTVREVMGR